MKKKIKYEKPVAMDMGSLTYVHGSPCSSGGGDSSCQKTGHGATGDCTGNGNKPAAYQCYSVGNDPNVAPVCMSGNTATYNCGTGNVNMSGNCTPGGAARGCYAGDAP